MMRRNARFFHAKIGSLLLLAILTANLVAEPVPVAHAAATWYVLPAGNDANNCQAPTTACATIAGALGKAGPGDTINMAPGTYVERLTIGKSIAITGAGAATTTIDANLVGTAITISA